MYDLEKHLLGRNMEGNLRLTLRTKLFDNPRGYPGLGGFPHLSSSAGPPPVDHDIKHSMEGGEIEHAKKISTKD